MNILKLNIAAFASLFLLTACGGAETTETVDESTVEGAAAETMNAADAAGKPMAPAARTEAAVTDAMAKAEEKMDAVPPVEPAAPAESTSTEDAK